MNAQNQSLLPMETSLAYPAFPSSKHPLHIAARQGNLHEVQALIQAKYNPNEKDTFGSTPLHLAAMYGHDAVIEYLLQNGAHVNAHTYKEEFDIGYGYFQQTVQLGFTPLDLAVKYAPSLSTLTLLINKGALPFNAKDLCGLLEDSFDAAFEKGDYASFDLILSKLELLAQSHYDVFWDMYDYPTSAYLNVIATEYIKDTQFYDRAQKAIACLKQFDTTGAEEHYVLAKNLLHTFPSENEYALTVGNDTVVIAAEGHNASYTVQLAVDTLNAFQDNIATQFDYQGYQQICSLFPMTAKMSFNNIGDYTETKQVVFNHVTQTFELGNDIAQKIGLYETSEQAFNSYSAGETVLLACGWAGHAVDIILDKTLNLFAIANAGDQFLDFTPGFNAYNHQLPLTVNDIYNILTKQEKMELEFKQFYDLGMEPNLDYSIYIPEQSYGNCAWYSQQISERGLLFLELAKITQHTDLSKELSAIWFDQLDTFHQTQVLQNYLARPSLEPAALADILVGYHGKLALPAEKERATLLLDTLTSNENKAGFIQYYQTHSYKFTPELKQFMSDNGYSAGVVTPKKPYYFYNLDGKTSTLKMDDLFVAETDDQLAPLYENNTHTPPTFSIANDIMAPSMLIPILPAMQPDFVEC